MVTPPSQGAVVLGPADIDQAREVVAAHPKLDPRANDAKRLDALKALTAHSEELGLYD